MESNRQIADLGNDSKIKENLKDMVSQLKSEISDAFSEIKGNTAHAKKLGRSDYIDLNMSNDNNQKNKLTNINSNEKQIVRLMEYLLQLKEKQIDHLESYQEINNNTTIYLAGLFLESLYKKPSLSNIMDSVSLILHTRGLILWQQSEVGYRIYSTIPEKDAKDTFLSVLPILANQNKSNFAFEYEKNYYFAHTASDDNNNVSAVLMINNLQKNYTTEEQELAVILSEVLFKLSSIDQ